MVVVRACHRLGWELRRQRCVVQGFGNVGSIAARELYDHGARVTAVSDVSGGIYSEAGLDIHALDQQVRDRGSLADSTAGEQITNEELLELDCDILVVAAGRDPRTTPLGEIAEPPHYTIDPDVPLEEAFRFLEQQDAERVPVVDGEGRLIGVLSRSVLRRRLAEDEEPPYDEDEPPELPPAA
jgi:CBS domain-containing protein